MKKLILFISFILFFNICSSANSKIVLTEEENLWIKNNPIVKLAVMSYWSKNEKNDEKNIHLSLLELLNKYGNLNLIPVTYNSWNSGYTDALKGENIHGIMGLSWSKERQKYFNYSFPYNFTPAYVITKFQNDSIKSFSDLENKTIYLKENSITHNIIKDKLQNTNIINIKTVEEMYEKLSTLNQSDAIFSYYINLKSLEKYNLKVIDTIYDKYGEVSIGTNKTNKILSDIINKIFQQIPKDELAMIRATNGIKFSQKEKDWIKNNHTIKYLYSSKNEPFEWSDKIGNHSGIVADLIKIIEQKSKLNFEVINSNDIDEIKSKIQTNDKTTTTSLLDIKENKNNFNFTTNNIYSTPYVFVSANKQEQEVNFSNIKNKKIGIIKNKEIYKILNQKRISKEMFLIEDSKEGFQRIADKTLDILIVDAITAKYYIDILEFDNIHILNKTIFNLDLKIAVSKDTNSELITILDKTIKSITKKEISDIEYRWIHPKQVEKTDWLFVGKIIGAICIILIIVFINNQKLKSLVSKKTKDIEKQKAELENLLESFNKNVIFSKTDLEGNITSASDGFCKISGYTNEELIGKPHNIIRHPDMPKKVFKEIWESLKKEYHITKEVKNLRKDGSFYWVESRFEPDYNSDGVLIGYSALRQDITAKKEVEELSANLEIKIEQRTKELEHTKEEVEKILASILLPVLITSKETRKIIYANKYAEIQYDTTLDDMIGNSIDQLYTAQGQQEHIIDELKQRGYVENFEESFRTHLGKEFTALLSVIPITYKKEEAYIGMTTDISKQKAIEKEIRQIHKHTRESIEYASLIQGALLPNQSSLNNYFKDHFVHWMPKDTVGGDIWLFDDLRHEDECLLFFVDCTGHGVPGAFVTMIVKAIEREITTKINADKTIDVSPAWIMSYFNKTMKALLKQNSANSISNAGWDGGIIYYNKKDMVLKFAGAETPLFYVDTDGTFNTIKGNRYSVGYKKCDMDYKYKETIIDIKPGMKFYCTTDGYLDQNGGEKDFPFGKKRFGTIIKENYNKPMDNQKEIFIDEMTKYESMIENNDRNDDMTVIGFEI